MTDDPKNPKSWQDAKPEEGALMTLKEQFLRLKEELEKEKRRLEKQMEEGEMSVEDHSNG